MHCVVTAGPTIEPLDQVRRLTNFSTGRLGMELAAFFTECGHQVTLLLSRQAVHQRTLEGMAVVPFTTTTSLREALLAVSRQGVDAVFHAAAVCDFAFGRVWREDGRGGRVPIEGGKISTREGHLLAELVPTPKLIGELRGLYPQARLVGWKYEVEGDPTGALAAATAQIQQCRTNACVANGPAYGPGFGLVFERGQPLHLEDPVRLFRALLDFAAA
ncbi:MAG: phosphopantothenoylcysteine decarboxylase [Verrucomicrobia bacterium]|jgi:phosphopantothenoylcysteine decarboxylase/phosphopantothenate--cysteine ligase|nr:phosphopantothenoylcysteine decarboxylase [Verrucomicrobiota bacterium]